MRWSTDVMLAYLQIFRGGLVSRSELWTGPTYNSTAGGTICPERARFHRVSVFGMTS